MRYCILLKNVITCCMPASVKSLPDKSPVIVSLVDKVSLPGDLQFKPSTLHGICLLAVHMLQCITNSIFSFKYFTINHPLCAI